MVPPIGSRKRSYVGGSVNGEDSRLRSPCKVVITPELRRIADLRLLKTGEVETTKSKVRDDGGILNGSCSASSGPDGKSAQTKSTFDKWAASVGGARPNQSKTDPNCAQRTDDEWKANKMAKSTGGMFKRNEIFKNLCSQNRQQCQKCGKEVEDIVSHGEECPAKGEGNILRVEEGQSFQTFDSLSKPDPLTCAECGKTFAKNIHLTLHQKIHSRMDKSHAPRLRAKPRNTRSSTGISEMCCNDCGQKFGSIHLLNSHKPFCQGGLASFHDTLFQYLDSTCDQDENSITVEGVLDPGASETTSEVPSFTENFAAAAKTVISTKTFLCAFCPLRFELKDELYAHYQVGHPDQPNPMGNWGMSEVNHQSNEVQQSPSPRKVGRPAKPKPKFTCKKCGKRFFYRSFLNFHMKSHAGEIMESKKIPCPKCKKSFPRRILREHSLLHEFSEEIPVIVKTEIDKLFFKCEHANCTDTRFSQAMDLEVHIHSAHFSGMGDKGKFMACEVCGKDFEEQEQLYQHRFDVHSVSRPVFHLFKGVEDNSIPDPYVLFKSSEKLAANKALVLKQTKGRNMARVRTDIPYQDIYKCDTCSRTFKMRNLYLSHLALHKREEMYKCNLCERKCLSEGELEAHLKKHEDPNYTYVPGKKGGRVRSDIPFQDVYTCDKCSKKFDVRQQFFCHLAQHKREETMKCKFCERICQNEYDLEEHEKKHEDPNYVYVPRPRFRDDIPIQDEYTCETCGKNFKQRNLYLSHLSQHRREKYSCNQCHLKFTSEEQLEEHVERHKDPSYDPTNFVGRRRFRTDIPKQLMYQCETCGKKFSGKNRRSLYIGHLSLHRREEKYTCPLCGRKNQSEMLYLQHMERHKDPNYDPNKRWAGRYREDIPIQDEYTCDKCEKVFKERNIYLGHLSMHAREEKFTCKQCGCKCGNKFLLEQHMKRHEDPNYKFTPKPRSSGRTKIPHQTSYTCELCGKKFSLRTSFAMHRHYHKTMSEGRFKCQICQHAFGSAFALEQHIKKHSNPNFVVRERRRLPDLPEYSCDKCDLKFQEKGKYRIHCYTAHKDKFNCQYCSKSFTNVQRLLQHEENHSDPNFVTRTRPGRKGRTDIPKQDVYYCKFCGNKKMFTERQRYLIHLNHHEKQDKYECPHCPRRFRLEETMKAHVESHVTEKSWKCEDCLKMFRSQAVRDIHKQKYCKKVPCKYKCGRCSDRFHNKITLARHFERWHAKGLGITPTTSQVAEIELSCRQCSQTFNTELGLKRHVALYHPTAEVTFDNETIGGGVCGIPDEAMEEEAGYDDVDDNNEDEDLPPILNFCETEISEGTETITEPSSSAVPLSVPILSGVPPPVPRIHVPHGACGCGLRKRKYKSQKNCVNTRCPCVLAQRRCSEKCQCQDGCLNSADSEHDQLQKFKEGRASWVMEQQQQQQLEQGIQLEPDIVYGSNSLSPPEEPEEPMIHLPPSAPAISVGPTQSLKIASSEVVSIDVSPEDESLRQLSFSGYVEGDDDPLADPLSDPEPQAPAAPPHPPPLPPSLQLSATIPRVVPSRPPPPSTAKNKVPLNWHVGRTMAAKTDTVVPVRRLTVTAKASAAERHETFNQTAHLHCQFCKKNIQTMPAYMSHLLLHKKYDCRFSCPICTKNVSPIDEFFRHLAEHNQGVIMQCQKCSSKFKTNADLNKHLKVHHYKPMECGLCNSTFANSNLMMTHWTKEHPTCQCGLCMVKFFSYDDLTFHMKSLHSNYDCSLCGDLSENHEDFLSHLASKHGIGSSKGKSNGQQQRNMMHNKNCNHCGLLFSSDEELNEHLVTHLNLRTYDGNNLTCHECSRTFSNNSELADHLAQHILGSNKTKSQFTSGLSPRAFETPSFRAPVSTPNNNTDYNINDNLEASEVFYCPSPACKGQFGKRLAWVRHVRTHREILFCSVCYATFQDKNELRQHTVTSTCKVYMCDKCSSNFSSQKYLSQHWQRCNSQISDGTDKDSSPVIVGSSSLAPPPSAQTIAYIVVRKECEEIVLD